MAQMVWIACGLAITLGRDTPKSTSGGRDLMLKRYGEKALEELFTEQDHDGAAVWRRIIDAVSQLANTTPSGRLH